MIINTNEHSLQGILHLPQLPRQKKSPVIIICHGFISSKTGQHRLFVQGARELCKDGYAVLRFDFSGCGDSTGEYKNVSVLRQLEETQRVIDFVAQHPEIDARRIILLGHSLGGAIAAATAANDNRIYKLILLSPVASPFRDIVNIVGTKLYEQCLKDGVADYDGFQLGKQFFASLAKLQPLKKAELFGGDVLIVHGSCDLETPLENAILYRNVFERRECSHCDLQVVHGADHTYSSTVWKTECFAKMLKWLNRDCKYKISRIDYPITLIS